jgi:hypothetical protein
MNLHRTRHFFIDVEAFGPPGVGSPFALACVPFDLTGKVGVGKQWNFTGPDPAGPTLYESATRGTLRWLLDQPEAVRAQTLATLAFNQVWNELEALLAGEGPVMLWSDDWSDFAWIDDYARTWACGKSIRSLGCSADSTGFVELAKRREPNAVWPLFNGTRHVALDDATHGARELCHALALLGINP